MKKIFLFLFIVFLGEINAQYTNIPDSYFEQSLIDQGIDSEGVLDNQVLTSDINTIEFLDVSYGDISNLTGIEDFSALRLLDCNSNMLLSLDLFGNNELEKLDCSYNDNLAVINLMSCSVLEYLDASYTNFGSIDVSLNPLLKYLYLFNNNQSVVVENLNISNNPELLYVVISGVCIQNIDLSNNPNLIFLNCSNNFCLYELDVSNCTSLKYLHCNGNYLSEINLENNLELRLLLIGNANGGPNTGGETNELTSLDLSNNINLEYLLCQMVFKDDENPYTLDLSNNSYLNEAYLGANFLSFLDIANGNNHNLQLDIEYNQTLNCVQVDNQSIADQANADENNWLEDDQVVYSVDCETIVVKEATLTGVSLSPNPIKNSFSIDVGDFSLQGMQLTTIDGQTLQKTKDQTMDISAYTKGVYLVKILLNNGRKEVVKIVKE